MHSKGNHKQDEKATLRMGEIFANEAMDKGLISKIYTQLMPVNIKNKQTTQSKNGQKT